MKPGRWRGSIRAQLLGLMLIVGLPLMIANAVRTYDQLEAGREAARDRLRQAAELMADRTDDWMESASAMFLSLADPIRRNWDERATLDSLLAISTDATNARFVNFFVVDLEGRSRGSGVQVTDRDTLAYLTRDYFEAALREPGVVVGKPRRSFVLEGRPWVVVVAQALRDADGNVMGVMAAPVRVDTLTDFIRIASLAEQPLVTILDTSGVIVARSTRPEMYVGRDTDGEARQYTRWPDTTTVTMIPGSDGTPRLTASVRATRAPWLVNVGVPPAVFEAPFRRQLEVDLIVFAIALAVATAGALLAGGRIAQPLDELAADAQAIAAGQTGRRTTVRGPTEIRLLGEAFNSMAASVEERSAELRENEQRYRFLFDSNPLPMWAWNAESLRILAVNEAAVAHYGYTAEQFLSMKITDLLDESERQRFGEARLPFIESRQSAGTWRHLTATGAVVEMEVITTSSTRLGQASWLSIGIDITARRAAERALAQSEEQLRQSQKMEAIGAFAGGIAHDFNNLLTGMLGYCELVLGELASNHPSRVDIVEIRDLAQRGADLTRQILTVSRKQVVQPSALELSQVVAGLDRLLQRLVGEHITVQTRLAPNLGTIRADASQLEQVILNLVANARDAMPDGGTLTITTRGADAYESRQLGLPAAPYVCMTVRDTGAGMTDATRLRIFEPFFTTKARGKGTGLGLALVYAMVQQADGEIRVDSAPGAGTTFHLYFPVAESLEPVALPEARPETDLGGSETILLAEDESSVRAVATAILERRGYRVLAAPDGPSALALSRSFKGPIDLLLSDVVMPGMHGRELAELLLKERPSTRILFASGYTDDAVLLRGIHVDEVPFLQKPFTPSQLARRVRDVLDEPVRGA